MEYFCNRVWSSLVDVDGDGQLSTAELERLFRQALPSMHTSCSQLRAHLHSHLQADAQGDGEIDARDLSQIMAQRLSGMPVTAVVAKQCLSYADADQSGKVSWSS